MIDAEIVYARAESAEDAVEAWLEFSGREAIGANGVRYLGGGTEIVTDARRGGAPAVVIDVKRIPEARRLEIVQGKLHIGAAFALNEAADAGPFPLFAAVVRRIADRTVRNRLSVGGNLAGALPYREAALPLLLADATILTIGPAGGKPVRAERPLRGLFEKRLRLGPGELILGFALPVAAASLPWKHYRAVRTAPVDYPLVTACFLDRRGEAANGRIEAAVSGLHPYPVFFGSIAALRSSLADRDGGFADQRASAAYRVALAVDMVRRAEEELA